MARERLKTTYDIRVVKDDDLREQQLNVIVHLLRRATELQREDARREAPDDGARRRKAS